MKNKSQALKLSCFICENTTKKILCKKCSKDPFIVEDARLKAATQNSDKLFKELYENKNYAEIKNVNNKLFWDKHFSKEQTLKDQDIMTQEKIEKLVSLLPKKKIRLLDLGFGQGYLEEKIFEKELKTDITGLDISASAVTRAKKKFKGKYLQGDLDHINKVFKERSFNVVSAIEVIEHISPHDIFKFFRRVRTLLVPKGILLISTPINENLRSSDKNPSGHVRDYSIEVLKKELELSGFTITNVSTLYAFEKYYSLKSYLAWLFKRRWKPNSLIIKAVKTK